MRQDRRTVLALLSSSALLPRAALTGTAGLVVAARIDWSGFLSRHDLVWDRLPQAWDEGPFLGDGMLGLMIYQDGDALRFDISRADVQDHRDPDRATGYDRARLPIGHFRLRTLGRLSGGSMRLVLHDAEALGVIVTTHGRIAIRAYVHATDHVIVIDATPSAGERDIAWEWVGEEAISPRQSWGLRTGDKKRVDPDYVPNPPGIRRDKGEMRAWVQPLLAGGGTATSWRETAAGSARRLIIGIAHEFPSDGAAATARAAVDRAAAAPRATLDPRHRDWWRAYYPRSFVTLPDARMESFYWIQMYKLASATRADGAYLDNQGPWLQPTAWPYATWNLNVQLSYWPCFASNRVDLSRSLIGAIHDHQTQLIDNVDPFYRADSASLGRSAGTSLESSVKPPPIASAASLSDDSGAPEMGNLPWALHDVWLAWRYSMDERILRDTLFPVLRRVVNYYRHFLREGADERLHLPVTYSPEYGSAPDANYDLGLLRWGCGALIDAAARLGIADPLAGDWRRILDRLVDYPRDDTGFTIGAGVPMAFSHRHYSHLLMAYPLYLVNREQPGGADIIKRSIDHWQSRPEMLRGYSSTGAASISAALGLGNDALRHLRELFSEYLRPNTLYKESGPVIETPLSGAQSIHDMLIQSWGGTIRIFPAMPSAWADAAFHDLLAEGAFLVSAQRRGGRTLWARVRSQSNEPCAVRVDLPDPVVTVDGRPRPFTRTTNGALAFALAPGEEALIHPSGLLIRPVVAPLPALARDTNSFGLNARSILPRQKDQQLGTNPLPSAGR